MATGMALVCKYIYEIHRDLTKRYVTQETQNMAQIHR